MAEKMENVKDIFNQFSDLMEQNIRGVQIGCYSVALVGLTIAIRRVRPFSRFKKPSDIPNRFIHERRELIGTVERIEPSGALLMVQHKPLLAIPGVTRGSLPVKLSGINVTGHGISWLQAIVVGNEIKFIPVLKEKDAVQCEVLLTQNTYDKKLRMINVAESLLSVGFGTLAHVDKPLAINPSYGVYYNRLKTAETYAIRKKLGIKYYVAPTKLFLLKTMSMLQNVANKAVSQSSKKTRSVPKLAVS